MSHTRRAVPILFVTALFLYFYTESVLRQTTLNRLKTPKLNVEVVLSKLPPSIRNSAKKSLEIAKLKDAVTYAATDREKVSAMSALAFAIGNKKEMEKLYTEILKHQQYPESVSAFAYFLLDDRPDVSVSIKDYHSYIQKCVKASRCNIWTQGLSRIESKKVQTYILKDYLRPLMSEQPPYSDYISLYDKLSEIALTTKDSEMLEKAGLMQEQALTRPSAAEELFRNERNKK
ncbi:MAG: hypothetical protein WCS96_05945 [Victivallales bacterium]